MTKDQKNGIIDNLKERADLQIQSGITDLGDKVERAGKHIGFYTRLIQKIVRAQDVNFWVLVSFLPTFVIARLIVYHFPQLFLEIGNVHVHHLTYGIVLLAVSGLLLLNNKKEEWKEPLALLYGVGLGLAFDEFGMWLHLEDNYWIRHSYDAVITISALLVSLVYVPGFIRSVVSIWINHTRSDQKDGVEIK